MNISEKLVQESGENHAIDDDTSPAILNENVYEARKVNGKVKVVSAQKTWRQWLLRITVDLIQFVLMLAILFFGFKAAYDLVENKKKISRQPKSRRQTIVTTQPIELTSFTVTLEAFGYVKSARNVTLQSRVRGEVEYIHPELFEGGLVKRNDVLISLDKNDYQLELKQRQAELKRVKTEIAIEEGNQAVARKEFEIFGNKQGAQNPNLVLRKPQLESLEAKKGIAEVAIDQVKLNIERTQIKAPFHALVRSKNIELGANVSSGQSIAQLSATDHFWIEVSLPLDELPFLDIAGQHEITVSDTAQPDSGHRQGRIVRQLSEIEAQGRMARLLIAVDDPLCLKPENRGKLALLLGSFVKVKIKGKTLENVAIIPRAYVHDNDELWLMQDGQLFTHAAQIAWRDKKHVIVAARHDHKLNKAAHAKYKLQNGDALITNELAAPVPGMAVITPEAFRNQQAARKQKSNQERKVGPAKRSVDHDKRNEKPAPGQAERAQ